MVKEQHQGRRTRRKNRRKRKENRKMNGQLLKKEDKGVVFEAAVRGIVSQKEGEEQKEED